MTTEQEVDNTGLIEEMLRDANKVSLGSSLKDDPVVFKGDETLPAPIIVNEIKEADRTWVWDTETGERVPVLNYMLPKVLRRKNAKGNFRFTIKDPGIIAKSGHVKCLLHPEGANRAHYDELGLRVCKKSNLKNEQELRTHMAKKHRAEWETIENERKEKERQEDREYQQTLTLAVAKALGVEVKTPSPIAQPVEVPEVEAVEEDTIEETVEEKPAREMRGNEYFCTECQAVHRESSRLGKRHKKYDKDEQQS
jgi:hypothetical protein